MTSLEAYPERDFKKKREGEARRQDTEKRVENSNLQYERRRPGAPAQGEEDGWHDDNKS